MDPAATISVRSYVGKFGRSLLRVLLFLAGVLLVLTAVQAQNAGLGTSTPDPSALFELSSTNSGLLTPRMTTAQRNAIVLPAAALLIFNTSDNRFQYNAGTPAAPDWRDLVTLDFVNSEFWSSGGNASTNPATDFVGTTDAQPLVLRTNNGERMRIAAGGNVGVGTTNPLALLSVGPNSEFRVSAAGRIEAAAGIVSSGDIDFTALNGGGLVAAAVGTGRLSTALAGTDYELPLTFSNGLTRSSTSVGLGGSMTTNTVIASAGFNLVYSGAGRLGLDVANPLVKLDVNGALRLGNAATATSGVIRWSGTDFEGHDGTQWRSFTSGGGGGTGWNLTGNSATAASFLGTVNAQDLRLRVNNVQRLLVTTDGNVGIGLTAPQQMLDVAGAIRLGNTAQATGGSIRFTGLDFEGHDGSAWISLTGSLRGWSVTGNSIDPGDFLGTVNARDLPFRSNNTEHMRITTTGNIGIGTATPTARLDVNGTVKLGTRGTTIANIIKVTVNADVGSLGSNDTRIETITVAGARTGATVFVSPSEQLPAGVIIGHAFVDADDSVEIKFVNIGIAPANPTAQDFYVTIIE